MKRNIKRFVFAVLLFSSVSGSLAGPSVADKKDIEKHKEISRGRNEARVLIRERNFSEAIILLERLRGKVPEYHELAEMLSSCYLNAGRPQDAVTLLEKRLESSPGRIGYVTVLGRAYLDTGRKEKALETWHSILGGSERQAVYYRTISELEWAAGMYREAIETLRQGTKVKKYYQQYLKKIIMYEMILEDYDAAFMDELAFLDAREVPLSVRPTNLFDIFRVAGRPEKFLAVVDSLAENSENKRRFFEMLGVLLEIDMGRFGDGGKPLPEMELNDAEMYYFSGVVFGMKDRQGYESYHRLVDDLLARFTERYPGSPIAPQMMLAAANYRMNMVVKQKAGGEEGFTAVLSLIDKVIEHPLGAAYSSAAFLLKAKVLQEYLYKSEEALVCLDRAGFVSKRGRLESESLRMKALLASDDLEKAKIRFEKLASEPDSSMAVLGRFGQGMLHYLSGEYEKSIAELSDLAEECPWSEWANDALETAMLTKSALEEGTGSLNLYALSEKEQSRGRFEAAARALDSLETAFPGSVILTRAVYMKGLVKEKAGKVDEARQILMGLVENHPMDDYAPRALEELGRMAEKASPDSAAVFYGRVLERYPEYPFIARIRRRYIALKKTAGGGAAEVWD